MAHVLSNNLRQAVLQAAFQGELTKQLSTDTPVEYTLQTLQLNKKSQNQKSTDSELLFDIPDTWAWVHIPDIAISYLGKTLNKSKDVGIEKPYLCSINVTWTGIDLSVVKHANFSDKDISKYLLRKGDMLISEGGDVGKTAIWENDMEMYYQNALHRVRFADGVSPYLYQYLMKYYKSIGLLDDISKGMTFKHLVQNALFDLCLPFPPIEEQQRIVDRVNELMAKIDEYEKLENQLVQLKEQFPKDMRDSLLQAAMQGFLTNRKNSDSNLFDYIEEIKKAKHLSVKNKATKNDKTNPVDFDEVPFEIPEEWQWVKLGMLANLKIGKTPPRSEPIWWGKKGDIPWVSISDMEENGKVKNTKEFISSKGASTIFNNVLSPKGTLIMSFKLTIGRVSLLETDALHNEAIVSIFPYVDNHNISQKYLFKILPYLTKYGDNKNAIKGNTLNSKSLCNLYIPLPPIEEQQRIVDKLDEMLPLVDALAQMD